MSEPTPPASARPNVDIVKQVYEAFTAKDMEKIFRLFSPGITLRQSDEVPWGGVYKGHDGAKEFFGALTRNVSSAVTFDRFIDAGVHVVALGRTRGTAAATGKPFDVPIAHVWTIENGRATDVLFCIDNPTMRAALS